ncbi:hypothetical protein ASU31_00840 [Pedobacter ginsenosidimutans]|uniref:Uncharacterized protein n=1 Tax=Pedobacter ginsenosidimutans TaxID=687842 RepID=A0A0T5VVN7_9SPHI|nr:hypothetical protein [Pedobacter ginsenosidimutans]KRT17872.1 hypothetical protein ASU31_00840 [Pedobacter ginsenosidimutans]
MKIFIISAFFMLLISCKKTVSIDEIFVSLSASKTKLSADGLSMSEISVQLSPNSSADRRTVVFTTTSGNFIPGNQDKALVKAEYNDGVLIAKVLLRSPLKPGMISVSVSPEFDSPNSEYILSTDIEAVPSEPFSMKIEPSGFGISSNFLTEIKLRGLLKNSENRPVSSGFNVVFEDVLLSGLAANGRFRAVQNQTADSSSVSAIYSAPAYPIGTEIKIRAVCLDSKGKKTVVRDSLLLTVNK